MLFRLDIGEYLKSLREEKKMPLRKVAAGLDIDQSTLSKIERGERIPSLEVINKASIFFNEDERKLLLIYKVGYVSSFLVEHENFEEITELVKERVKYLRNVKAEQGRLEI